tara:strand:+ start:1644 stop:2084 length:441 start_codon:yes stop_codon:yes gene_type:complete
MENTYWHRNGTYQADYDRLLDLMPMSGKCETVAGEMIRAVSKLGHELYNNGMGNNSSGAVNFLMAKGAISKGIYETIYPMTRGRIYNGYYDGDPLQMAIEGAVDQTIKFILDNPILETQENLEDMHDLSDEYEDLYDEEMEEEYYA